MRIGVRTQYLKNGEMKVFSYTEHDYDTLSIHKPIRKWYKRNPYAKRVSKHWICQDYRIDQQRPQRNVYSEAYIKIVSMTEIEERVFDNLIESIEKDIDYPTVWDDGVNRYYEDTIHCPNCGKRRKVLTSKTHCEFCGFEFDKALKCPKCHDYTMKSSKHCNYCGYEFRKESFINDDDFEVKKDSKKMLDKCPKCHTVKSKYFDECQECGFSFKNKKQCIKCGEWVDDDGEYCMYCGQKLNVLVVCKNCGKENNGENRFCTGCGEEL